MQLNDRIKFKSGPLRGLVGVVKTVDEINNDNQVPMLVTLYFAFSDSTAQMTRAQYIEWSTELVPDDKLK